MSTNSQDIFSSIDEHINQRCKEIIDKERKRLNKEFNAKNATMDNLLEEISSTKKELDEKEEQMIESYKEYQENLKAREEAIARACENTSPDKYTKINIGGKIFETLTSTLSSISPYFARLFSDDFGEPIKDNEGNIFIDKSPIGFKAIINWARLGKDDNHFQQILVLMQEKHNKNTVNLFIKTIDYFGINYDNLMISHGQQIKIYWRGDKALYDATIISSLEDLPKIQVQYKNDNECWEYDYMKLKHKTGIYNKFTACSKVKQEHGKPLYWHYGTDRGSKKIDAKGRRNPRPSIPFCQSIECKTEESDSSDED
jgi:AraC-like DNA-binding protein